MKIKKHNSQPDDSIILNNWIGNLDYVDSYQFDIIDSNNISIDELAQMILSSDPPKWEQALLRLRDSVVGLFGLKTAVNAEARKTKSDPARYEPGDRIGLFPVTDRSESEIVMALDDKHLGFRVSLLKNNFRPFALSSVHMTTVVQFHNIWGKIYFLPVKPFHKIIVKQSLVRFLKHNREFCPCKADE